MIATDCYDVYKANKSLPGIYTLNPNSHNQFNAYCLSDGWTVIQSRGQFGNPKDFFLRKWDDYVQGFGEPGLINILNSEQWNSTKLRLASYLLERSKLRTHLILVGIHLL